MIKVRNRTIAVVLLALVLTFLTQVRLAIAEDDALAHVEEEGSELVYEDALLDEGLQQEEGSEAIDDEPIAESGADVQASIDVVASDGDELTADQVDADESIHTEDDIQLEALSTKAEADALAAAHANALPNGRYVINTKLKTGFSIDVKGGSSKAGASIIIYTSKVANNQRWDVTNVDGGYVTIKSASSGKYLQAGWNGSSWMVVQANRDTSARGQLWILLAQTDGSFIVTSALDTSRVLDVRGGKAANSAQVIAYAANTSKPANQRWSFDVTTDILDHDALASKNSVADGTYIFTSGLNANYALDLRGSSLANSASIILYSMGPRVNQGWTIKHDDQGYATITNALSGKVLDVRGGKAVSGATIIQYAPKAKASRNQKWIVAKDAKGNITITSALVGSERLVLSVTGGVAKNSVAISLAPKSDVEHARCWAAAQAPEQYAFANCVMDGVYQIATALNAKKALDVSGGSTKEGVTVKLWTLGLKTNQLWTLSHDNQGFVHITNLKSNKYLSFVSGVLVQSATAYTWVIEPQTNGSFKLRSSKSGKYLDVSRSNTDNATNRVIVYTGGTGKNQQWLLTIPSIGSDTPIMGPTQISQSQAVRYINSHFANTGRKLPEKWTKDGETVAKIVSYFWEEGAAEGVRGDIALAQSIHETGWFQFGNLVQPKQYNFAGLGATGPGHPGNVFPSARIGVRAQIQHLKAYASTAPLNQECVDERFHLVSRGVAPTIAGLSGKWAVPGGPDSQGLYYHDYLVGYLNGMMMS